MSTYIGYPVTNLDELPPGGQPGDILVVGPGGQPGWGEAAASGIGTRIIDADYTLVEEDLDGGVIYVNGSAIITIPPVAEGASFSVITIGDVDVSVDPDAADLIYLNGVPQADGEKISNDSSAGDMAVFTYYDATGWVAMTNPGWTNGG